MRTRGKNIYRERMSEPTIEWFLSRVKKHKNGCWEVLSVHGKKMKRSRGFVVKTKGVQISGSRWVYEKFKGPLRKLLVCHTCDNGWCFNPEHMFKGTYSDNVIDAISKGRFLQATGPRSKETCRKISLAAKRREHAKKIQNTRAAL